MSTETPTADASPCAFPPAENGAGENAGGTNGPCATGGSPPVPRGSKELPVWQQLSGLTPEAEGKMSDEQRDEAIRTLLKKADELASAECQRAAPERERSFIWSPVERICFRLGIARSKLSAYCRELTGLSAQEWADRYPARALAERMRAWAGGLLGNLLERMKQNIGDMRSLKEHFKTVWHERALEIVRAARHGPKKIRWAAALKFSNLARLRRACLLEHGVTVEQLEEQAVHQLVQNIFTELEAYMRTLPEPQPEFLFDTYVRRKEFVCDFGFVPQTKQEMEAALHERRVRQLKEEAEQKEREAKERREKEKQEEERERQQRAETERRWRESQGQSGWGGMFEPPGPFEGGVIRPFK